MTGAEDSRPNCRPSPLDCERVFSLEEDGKMDSEAQHESGMPMWSLFRYPPLKATPRKQHYLLFWIDSKNRMRQTDSLVSPDAVVAFLSDGSEVK